MDMKLLAVVTPPYLSHGCSSWKTFWEEKFTLGKFASVNMISCSRCNVRKQREIKNGEEYITFDISLKFFILYNMKITSSGPKYYLKTSIKGLIASLGLKTIVRSNKDKKVRYAITNVIMKDLSKMIKKFEKLPHESYMRKRPKHELTDSCSHHTLSKLSC